MGRDLLAGDQPRAAGMLRTAVGRPGSIADDVSTGLVWPPKALVGHLLPFAMGRFRVAHEASLEAKWIACLVLTNSLRAQTTKATTEPYP